MAGPQTNTIPFPPNLLFFVFPFSFTSASFRPVSLSLSLLIPSAKQHKSTRNVIRARRRELHWAILMRWGGAWISRYMKPRGLYEREKKRRRRRRKKPEEKKRSSTPAGLFVLISPGWAITKNGQGAINKGRQLSLSNKCDG